MGKNELKKYLQNRLKDKTIEEAIDVLFDTSTVDFQNLRNYQIVNDFMHMYKHRSFWKTTNAIYDELCDRYDLSLPQIKRIISNKNYRR